MFGKSRASSAGSGQTDKGMADTDFEFLCKLVYERSRINLGPEKRVLVTSRLAARLRHHGLNNYEEYCQLLRSPKGAEELTFLIDRISTNHTQFFREIKHFDFLRDNIIPSWRAVAKRAEPFRVWSAASSSGEEAYSIAIQLAEHFAEPTAGRWQIHGTDISTRVLDMAKQGIYEAGRLDNVPQAIVHRYFQRGTGSWEGSLRVKEEIRRCVSFQHLNLLDAGYPFNKSFDLIFCRNVMIYFDRPTQEMLVHRLSNQLSAGCYMMVGHSESLSGIKHNLKHVQPAVYLKT